MTEKLEKRNEQIVNELQTWFTDNNIHVNKESCERFLGIINRNKLLHDEWMDETRKRLEDSLLKTLKKYK